MKSLYDYLSRHRVKVIKEQKQNRIDKKTIEVYELAGELVGLEMELKTHQIDAHRLVSSNADSVGKMQVNIATRNGVLTGKKKVLARLEAEFKAEFKAEYGV